VARAKPDGYTLLVAVNATLTMNPFVQRSYPFDPLISLTPVSLAARSALALAVNASLPVTSVDELVRYARARPGALSYGSAGLGTGHHVAGEMIKKRAGVDMVHIPYKGSNEAIQALVAGQIQVSFGSLPAVMAHAAAGAIRILAVTEERRVDDLPNVPTVAESIPGVVVSTWVGLYAPAGTPAAVVERLHAAVHQALQRADVAQKLSGMGLTVVDAGPAELLARTRAEYEGWSKAFPELGIRAE